MIDNYLINLFTSALISHFDNGYEYTQIIEGKQTFIVRQSPDDIVKASVLHLGSNLDGAIESARLILKKKYKVPIGLSIQHNIFLIRCHSIHHTGIVWVVNSHIHDIEPDPNDRKKTIIHFIDNHSLTVHMKVDLLQTKRNQALYLHSVLLERSKMTKTMTLLYEEDKGIIFVKEAGQLNYTVKSKEKEKEKEVVKNQSAQFNKE
ncbi:competence protein ComK [Niallia oryzisoli]|uniref:Competence protein ComK n=1 Tax=Niallia oryzisoli TaxID=1737571 RepID=A0ABZ2CIT3_9BACI